MAERIIDVHLHLDERVPGPAAAAVDAVDSALSAAGIARGVVLHLLTQRWSVEEVAAALASRPRLAGFVNVDPRDPGALEALQRGLQLGFVGLKLHPRLHRFAPDDPRVVALVAEAGRLGVPALIDAFPDGDALMAGFDPTAFARLARACPGTRVVAAHMGGHRALDLMMVAKRTPNLWLDCSYSLLYYRGSSVPGDMIYAMSSMRFERVMYGSDAPDRPIDVSLRLSRELLEQAALDADALDRLLYRNAAELLRWTA